ncbi:MAG: three-Cys-motif partner protein TcmP [Syntrophales bacterium]|nr:three-Cys-motif partner protein TcmP [Syntrophales bacterium]
MENQPTLFDLPPESTREKEFKQLRNPIWTENKAKLIECYLYYFVLITKHGTYIDGFSGPQEPDKPGMWSAKLVLESKPRWFKNFYLFEKDPTQISKLEALKTEIVNESDPRLKRKIEIYPGDFNELIPNVLATNPIREKEATFCLLDQRTFECHWNSLITLAGYKKNGFKIELFYFLTAAWLDRSIAAVKNEMILENWWGNSGWSALRGMKNCKRAKFVASRIKDELHYESVVPWPIYSREDRGRVMYYMIHATDHPIAPGLMHRAYHKALSPKESPEQFELEFAEWKGERSQ